MAESRQPTEEEVRKFAEELEAWAGAGMKEPVKWQPIYRRCAEVIHSLLDELVAKRDVVAAQDKALRRIVAIKDQHTWSEDDALEAAEIAAAVVSGTPE